MQEVEFYKKMIEITKNNPEMYEIIQAIIIIYSKVETREKEIRIDLESNNFNTSKRFSKIEQDIKNLKINTSEKIHQYIKKAPLRIPGLGLFFFICAYSIMAIFFKEELIMIEDHIQNSISLWNSINKPD